MADDRERRTEIVPASALGALERGALGDATPTFVVRLVSRLLVEPGFFQRLLGVIREQVVWHVLCEDRYVILSYLGEAQVLASVVPFDGVNVDDRADGTCGLRVHLSGRWTTIELGADAAAAELCARLSRVASPAAS